jgi:hypothetical protein
MEKWDHFWLYFRHIWIPLLEKWNICDKDGEYYDMVNRTNNGIESYNRRFGALFPTKPTLIAFVSAVEEESHKQAQIHDNVRTGKMKEPKRRINQTIPSIPSTHDRFVFP